MAQVGESMDELEHIRDYLESYSGDKVADINDLVTWYEDWVGERPRLTPRILIKRLVQLGGYKRRSNGRTIIDITGVR